MIRIGLISDTHGVIIPELYSFLGNCDEIWHAGDIGSLDTAKKIEEFKPLKAVSGNIDGIFIRQEYPEVNIFVVEDMKVVMMHIGGYPGKYSFQAKSIIAEEKPALFIAGHSHILKVMFDKKHNLLYLNPGSCGKQGLHQKMTMIRFIINNKKISDLEIFEKPKH